jgi:hypothetical protein
LYAYTWRLGGLMYKMGMNSPCIIPYTGHIEHVDEDCIMLHWFFSNGGVTTLQLLSFIYCRAAFYLIHTIHC